VAPNGIRRLIATLALIMIAIFVAWETVERNLFRFQQPTDHLLYYFIRAASTAIIMSGLTAWLLIRYRRRYENQLRTQSEESRKMRVFFENIVKDAGEAIICLDNNDMICSWNRSAEEIYGYTSEEILGKSSRILFPQELLVTDEPGYIREMVRSKGHLRNFETRRVRKDGTKIEVRITRSILRDENGEMIGSSAIVSDITGRREMEARLIQAEKLAAIGETAATIAHEVRNALAGIAGTVEVLKGSALWGELPEGVGEEVEIQVSRIAHIVNDLLAYARPGRLLPQPIDIHLILDRAIAAMASSPESNGKRIVREYAPGTLQIDVDPARVEQAFQNIITNAYQSMGAGGTVRVRTARSDGRVEILFSDSGPGISPDLRERVFEPFFTTKARGTGLGLPIVKTIVEAHHGTIDLDSKPGSGTTVRLTLPAAGSARGKEEASCEPVSRVG